MSGKDELIEALEYMSSMADANICRMSDGTMRNLAHGIKALVSSEYTTRYSKEDVARYLGKSARTVERYNATYPDFPQPKHHGTKEVSYDCDEIIRWKNKHKYLFS